MKDLLVLIPLLDLYSTSELCDLVVRSNPTLDTIDNTLTKKSLLRIVFTFNVIYGNLTREAEELHQECKLAAMNHSLCYAKELEDTMKLVFKNPVLAYKVKRLATNKNYFYLLQPKLADLFDECLCHL